MHGSSPEAPSYHFGPFKLDTGEGAISRAGTRLKLQDLPYRLLVMLVERPGEVVTREELRQKLWPENTFVEFDNSLGVAVRKVRDALGDDAESPRYVETIPRRGYRFLAPVTIESASSVEVSSLPADSVVSSPVVIPPSPPRKPSRALTVAAMVAVLVGATIFAFRSPSRPATGLVEATSVLPQVRVRRSVAVLGFRNLPGRAEDNWLSPAFAEMLNTELAADSALRLVSGEDVARAKRELPLADEDTLAEATLDRLRTNPGADVVVLGSYTPLPGRGGTRLRLDIRLQETLHGETIAEQAFTGSEQDLFELATQAGGMLRQSLGMSSVSPEGSSRLRAALPADQQTVRLYTEGRAKLWAFDFLGARDLLTKAVASDPNYPLAHAALAEALNHLGYIPKARGEAERAMALSEHLPEENRLLIEGQYRVGLQEHPKAIEIYRKLFAQFPDSLDYGLRLADEQRWVSPEDTGRTLNSLRHLPPPSGDDPRIDLLEARAWMNTDLVKSEAAAKRAITKGSALGSHLIVARAYGILCQSGVASGSSTQAAQNCENAIQSSEASGDRYGQARTLSDFAGLYFELGDMERAKEMYRRANKVFQEVGDEEGLAETTGNLGAIYLVQGNLTEAKKSFEKSIAPTQAMGDKDGMALVLNNLASLYRFQGNLGTALTTYAQATATALEIEDKSALGYILTGIGDVLTDRGDLTGARKSYEESLALRQQAGQKQFLAETQVALAHLSVEEGHASDAEAALRKCKEQFHQERQADDELVASAELTQALLAEGKYPDAKQESEASAPLAAKNQNRLTHLQSDLASARVTLASDRPESARQLIGRVLQDARAHGFLGIEFEAQLVSAELEKKSGHGTVARAQLSALEKAAHAKGFALIEHKAAARQGA